MGAKTWMLAYVGGSAREVLRSNPELDREATSALAKIAKPLEILVTGLPQAVRSSSPPPAKCSRKIRAVRPQIS